MQNFKSYISEMLLYEHYIITQVLSICNFDFSCIILSFFLAKDEGTERK